MVRLGKKEKTTELVVKAIKLGYRGIDTACQPLHYREELVGKAVSDLIKAGIVKREDLFIQTKFSPGQETPSIPYNPKDPLKEQVLQSFKKSQDNLQTNYVGSLVLHSPLPSHEETMEAWRAMETIYQKGNAKQIGISNIYSIDALQRLWEESLIKPSIIQNRFYAETGFDQTIRNFCERNGIFYQSFWTLTANPQLVNSYVVHRVAKEKLKTKEQIFFRYVMELGIIPLTGTSNENHMKEDLEVLEFGLDHMIVKQIHVLQSRKSAGYGCL